jgi:hypothetical protein
MRDIEIDTGGNCCCRCRADPPARRPRRGGPDQSHACRYLANKVWGRGQRQRVSKLRISFREQTPLFLEHMAAPLAHGEMRRRIFVHGPTARVVDYRFAESFARHLSLCASPLRARNSRDLTVPSGIASNRAT